jgi:hypothetical protein
MLFVPILSAMKSNRMLLDEYPLVLFPSLAKAVGVNGAVIIQQLHYHFANPENGRVHNGQRWIFKTYEDWQTSDFPFWDARTVRRNFRKLEVKKLIVSCQPEGRMSRRKFYRIDYSELEKLMSVSHARTRTRAGRGQVGRFDEDKLAASFSTETTTENTAPLLSRKLERSTRNAQRRGRSSAYASGEKLLTPSPSLAGYTKTERKVIDCYHRTLCDKDSTWKRVTKHTANVCAAIKRAGDVDSCRQIFAAAANGNGDEVNMPKRRTLVRLLWENY